MTGTTAQHPAPRRPALLRLSALACAVLPLGAAACAGPASPAGDTAYAAASAPADELPVIPSFWPSAPASPTASAPAPAAGSAPASAPAAGSLTGRTVLLDAGHNPGNSKHTTEINRQVDIGNSRKECDTTGTATNASYSEAEYSLDVSRRARTLLEARGAKVVFTQDGNRPWGPCIDERAGIGNESRVDAAVSVHADGAAASASGFHVIMPAAVKAGKADTAAIVAPSRRLGLLLREQFKAATGEPYADYIGEQGLDTRSDLGGLNLSKVPKVFIECGNMRNSGDAKRMTDPQWRQLAAQGIADALTAYLTTPAN
ncbi:N-acetylmuramoyl-L-alanine amidase [Kitasatospora sp. NPDC002040]|uniref:N-acetylmuramoyl-L-alanine amidase n=1 Tax=Kitasatospora sp. NPDC002040 TaxID=3154661 RepID=UPI0033294103